MKITDQQIFAFAKLSGDFNPIHIDKKYASTSIFGTRILYGIYQVFLALEDFLSQYPQPIELTWISASFLSPIFDKKEIVILPKRDAIKQYEMKYEIFSLQKCSSTISFGYLPLHSKNTKYQKEINWEKTSPQDSVSYEGGGGDTQLYFDPSLLRNLFPQCFHKLHNLSIATLLATTRIVGMQCPGLNSIYSSLDLDFTHTSENSTILTYRYKTHKLLNCVNISLQSPIKGKIKAFIRPQRINNTSYQTLLSKYTYLLEQTPFKNQKALIIGASSGLGNACANLLSIGGAKVLASYKKNKNFEKIPNTTFFFYNALKPNQQMIKEILDFSPTHLYYFSTPKIQSIKNDRLQTDIFQDFINHYLFGFNKILDLNLPELKFIFCPSSIFVETLPIDFKEYILAKQLVETYLAFLSKTYTCYTPRLEKTLTNQTLEMIKQDLPMPDEIIIKELLLMTKQSDI